MDALLGLYRDPSLRFSPHSSQFPAANYPSIVISVLLYLGAIFLLRKWMESREKFELKGLVLFHNAFLSILSLAMTVGALYGVGQVTLENLNSGSTTSTSELLLCDPEKKLARGPHIFWFYIFYLSKFYEFLDTFIIILKKRPLIFLHVYHHVITLVLVFVMMESEVGVQWLCMVANAAVHIIMYFYYAVSSMGIEVWFKKYITRLQILQFVIDILAMTGGIYYTVTGIVRSLFQTYMPEADNALETSPFYFLVMQSFSPSYICSRCSIVRLTRGEISPRNSSSVVDIGNVRIHDIDSIFMLNHRLLQAPRGEDVVVGVGFHPSFDNPRWNCMEGESNIRTPIRETRCRTLGGKKKELCRGKQVVRKHSWEASVSATSRRRLRGTNGDALTTTRRNSTIFTQN